MRIISHSEFSLPKSGRSAELHDVGKSMAHVRVNMGWLARAERGTLRQLSERLPDWVTPDQLTILGVAGALLTMASLALCNLSGLFAIAAVVGLFLHWLGDSLDGTLARHRKIERPRIGYFFDHSCDLVSQTFIFIGLGLSPYFTVLSALLALSMYFLISSYTYLKVMIFRSHQLAYGGIGATELRLAIACWCLVGAVVGPGLVEARYMGHRMLDEVVGAAWGLVFLGFIRLVWVDSLKIRVLFAEEELQARPPVRIGQNKQPPVDGFPLDA